MSCARRSSARRNCWSTRLVERREFDGIADLAEAYPLKVFPDAVGISEEGRENLLPYGSMVFNSFGPRNDLFEQAMANAGPVRDWIMSKCSRAALAPGGLGMQIFDAVDAGELTEAEAGMLVRSFLSAGIDTTVYGLGNALYCFARYPEQWTILRENPSSDPSARSRRCCASRRRCRPSSAPRPGMSTSAGVRIGDGEKVLLFLAAANRDPRRWDRPDQFRRQAPRHRAHDLRHRHSWLRRAGGGAARKRGHLRQRSPSASHRSR